MKQYDKQNNNKNQQIGKIVQHVLFIFSFLLNDYFRGSRSQMFLKIVVLKYFAIFTGKHLCWSLFFNKVTGLKTCNFIKKRLQHRCFPVNIAKFLRAASFIEHLLRLLLLYAVRTVRFRKI